MSDPLASVTDTRDAIRRGERRAIARTITLLESTRADQFELGQQILEELVPKTGGAARVGITGPPGVGKSTFIEAIGIYLLERGYHVAVLAVDPSSPVTGGSILGDKTRMERLAQEERAFIRPSPSGGSLGGVANRTREAMLVCEAAGFDVILVETVGIGQSEVAVRSMVDFFLVLLQPGAGDELQGIKKGVIELADALVVNKADGDQEVAADRTRIQHGQALSLLRPLSPNWRPVVLSVSSLANRGIDDVWATILEHAAKLEASGERQSRRAEQARAWMWSLVEEGLRQEFRRARAVAGRIEALERDVEALKTTPAAAARVLLEAFKNS
ncbi:MAG: methylmalonyl Co-A mutase-associated GTPase MeaB [Deltaproteobacteria bacterium]|nr:methylmalonyl Co-A mutase-associated GTPase MeaB [Deltaproteobacteria bacterium]MBW2397666.1 methylmalonyl Co-A mutase-associated GTPase MeaB [Deltaproteobacteria bacterium]